MRGVALTFIFFFAVGSALHLSSAVRTNFNANKNSFRKFQKNRRNFTAVENQKTNTTLHTRDTDVGPEVESKTSRKRLERSIKENQEKLTTFETESDLMKVISDLESIRSTRSVTGDQLDGTDVTRTTYPPRLLVSSGEDRHFVEINLENNSRRRFPVYTGHARAAVYNPISQTFIWTNHTFFRRGGIYSVGVDGGAVTTLRNNVLTNGLAIDTARDLLFFGNWRNRIYYTWKTHGTVNVMTTTGGNYRMLAFVSSRGLNSIALDIDRQHIYACGSDRLLRMDYDGNNQVVMAWGQAIVSVLVDPVHQMLYYENTRQVVKRSLITGISHIMYQTHFVSWSMTSSNNDVLYIGGIDGRIVAIDMVSSVSTIIGYVHENYVTLCAIPSHDHDRKN